MRPHPFEMFAENLRCRWPRSSKLESACLRGEANNGVRFVIFIKDRTEGKRRVVSLIEHVILAPDVKGVLLTEFAEAALNNLGNIFLGKIGEDGLDEFFSGMPVVEREQVIDAIHIHELWFKKPPEGIRSKRLKPVPYDVPQKLADCIGSVTARSMSATQSEQPPCMANERRIMPQQVPNLGGETGRAVTFGLQADPCSEVLDRFNLR